LHVTVGAVSQQIKALQASLGIELFEKRGRQLVLTANGRQLQKTCRDRHERNQRRSRIVAEWHRCCG
jgi:DNA-binding transcriptional LysR family regulator